MEKMLTQLKLKINNFSMIEIVLALVVVVIGLIGIIGLFPVGIDSNRQAISKSYASDAAEQFLHFNASKIKVDWNWKDAFPLDNKYSGDDLGLNWGTESIIDNENVKIYFPLNDGDAANTVFDKAVHQQGIFKLQQMSQGTAEFSCILRCWQTVGSIVMHVEASYPAELPYEKRKKDEFSLRMVKSEQIALSDPGPGAGDDDDDDDDDDDGEGSESGSGSGEESGSGSGSGA